MSHQESYYRQNEAYAEFLAGWHAAFYAMYADTLKPDRPGAAVLDVGCGVGQVVARLSEAFGLRPAGSFIIVINRNLPTTTWKGHA